MYLYVGHKIRSGKCEGPGRGDRSVKEPELGGRRGKELEWEMRRTGAVGGGVFENIKVFLKNRKHEANIVEITHLCIMHGAHTSVSVCDMLI